MQTVLTIGGYVIGNSIAPGIGGQIGAALGAYIGGTLLADDLPTQYGPRLEDRRVQVSAYGADIPFIFGANRVAGNVIWSVDLEEVQSSEEIDSGKGGGPSQTVVTYTYFGTFAVLLGFGVCRGIRRIWADTTLIFDGSVRPPSGNVDYTFYPGNEDQLPDPTIEAAVGVGRAPAYRGFSYIVFNRLALSRFGNRIPNITVEALGDGEYSFDSAQISETKTPRIDNAVQLLDHQIVTLSMPVDGTVRLERIDPITGETLLSVDSPGLGDYTSADANKAFLLIGSMVYVPPINEIWVSVSLPIDEEFLFNSAFYRFDATSLVYTGLIDMGGWGYVVGAYDAVHNVVHAHLGSSQIAAVTYTVIGLDGVHGGLMDGMFYAGGFITGGSNIVVAIGGPSEFGLFRANVVPLVTGGDAGETVTPGAAFIETVDTGTSIPMGAWDNTRQRYVVVAGDHVYTVSDTDPPVVTDTVVSFGPSGAGLSPTDVVYSAALDAIVVTDVVTGHVVMTLLDAETFEVLAERTGAPWVTDLGITRLFPSPIDPGGAIGVGSYAIYTVDLYGSTVGAAVARLSRESGMVDDDFDVSALGQRLRGYLVPNVAPARGAIEQLALGFLFEGAEIDDRIVYVQRGGASKGAITIEDCGVGSEEPAEYPIQITRAKELDLPRRLSVTASDPATSYQPGTQYAIRRAAFAGEEVKLSFAIVLTVDECKQLAEALMYDRWASRERLSWATNRQHAKYTATDPITLDGRRVRILNRTDQGGLIEWEGVGDDQGVIEQSMAGVVPDWEGQTIALQVPTSALMMDLPLLRDADDSAGAYAALWGLAPFWRGGVLMLTRDGGLSYTRVATMGAPGSSVGAAINALGSFDRSSVFDEVNELRVTFSSGPQPESATRDALLAGSNAAAVQSTDGWEIIFYREATLGGDGAWTLRGLLRGMLGTERTMSRHGVSDRVVLLGSSTIRSIDLENADLGVSYPYKAVSIGALIADTPSYGLTVSGERLKPLAPVDLRVARDVATGDATLSWKRRTRVSTRFVGSGGMSVPLGEDSEAYEVDVYGPGSPTAVVRTITGLSSPEAAYSAANQLSDGITPGDDFAWAVYQISAQVGRGHPGVR